MWSVSFSDSLLYNIPFLMFPLLYNKCILWVSYTYTHFHVFLLLYSYSLLYNHILWLSLVHWYIGSVVLGSLINNTQFHVFLLLYSYSLLYINILWLSYSHFLLLYSLFVCSFFCTVTFFPVILC